MSSVGQNERRPPLVPGLISGRARAISTTDTRFFWDGLREGILYFQRCQVCRALSHEPAAGCAQCGADALVAESVPALGTVYTFTICELAFGPGLETPYVPALI
jgi:uncharacterized OB-fold protein